ncbi:MAG: hypothetical protein J5825_02410 [Lachnospiraceae bacterium]|nr:hypothetical protein [Lachnospiraceae bacterium]
MDTDVNVQQEQNNLKNSAGDKKGKSQSEAVVSTLSALHIYGWILTAIFGLLSLVWVVYIFYVGINGMWMGFQDWSKFYGTTAAMNALHPLGGLLYKTVPYVICLICLVIQLILLRIGVGARLKMLVVAIISIAVIILSLILVDPVSRAYRTNRDIPEELTGFCEDQFGKDGLKIIEEKRYDNTVYYSVTSPACPNQVNVVGGLVETEDGQEARFKIAELYETVGKTNSCFHDQDEWLDLMLEYNGEE